MTEPSQFAKSFFGGLVDYAGLFPPAKLPLTEAVSNYRSYLNREDSWILSRFILTSGHFAELQDEHLRDFSAEKNLDVSLISRDLSADLPAVLEKLSAHQQTLRVGSIEAPLALDRDVKEQVQQNEEALAQLGPSISIFYEVPLHDEWDATLQKVVEVLAEQSASTSRLVGFKLRCGGIEDNLVPTPERVAKAITECAGSKLPMKFTAGLHHPFRHQPGESSPLSVPMHGYFNIFFAAFLANTQKPAVSELVAVVSEMDDVAPVISEDGVEWLGHKVSFAEIANLRTGSAISYGSCSFLEPVEDAQKLGWL